MSRFARIASTSIGKKLLMAVTGLGMAAWLIAHLTGNLKVFLGQKEVNEYALWLHDHPALLWPARIAMLVFILIHIRKGLQLRGENTKARPSKYQVETTLRAGFPSLHMAMSGIVLVLFIAMHLAHYTFHLLPGEYRNDAMGNPDVYSMMIAGFKDPLFSGTYVIALGFVGLHLWLSQRVQHAAAKWAQGAGAGDATRLLVDSHHGVFALQQHRAAADSGLELRIRGLPHV